MKQKKLIALLMVLETNPSINRTVESGVSLRSTPLSTAGYFNVSHIISTGSVRILIDIF